MSTTQKPEKSLDELEEERLFTPKKYKYDAYHSEVVKNRKRMEAVGEKDWHMHDVDEFKDPYAVQLSCLYSMLKHIMWKLATCENDPREMAFVEMSWDAAQEEAEREGWRLAPDPKKAETGKDEMTPKEVNEQLEWLINQKSMKRAKEIKELREKGFEEKIDKPSRKGRVTIHQTVSLDETD